MGNDDAHADKGRIARLMRECVRAHEAGQVSTGTARRLPGGRLQITFTFAPGIGGHVEPTESATARAARYMLAHRVLSRQDFFDCYPSAHNSASLHARAVKRLAVEGHITKERGLWIWATVR